MATGRVTEGGSSTTTAGIGTATATGATANGTATAIVASGKSAHGLIHYSREHLSHRAPPLPRGPRKPFTWPCRLLGPVGGTFSAR